MSMLQIVAHHLGFSSNTHITIWDDCYQDDGVSSLPDSAHGKQIFGDSQNVNNRTPTVPIMFMKWSDDFEPNSQAKQNHGACWCCMIIFYSHDHTNFSTMYIVALGEKDLDHHPLKPSLMRNLSN